MSGRSAPAIVLAVICAVGVGLWLLLTAVMKEELRDERRFCQYAFAAVATRRDTIDIAYKTRCQRHLPR